MFGWFKKVSLIVGTFSFALPAFAQVDNPISSYAPEVEEPEIVVEDQSKLEVSLSSDVNIQVPNTDSVAFFESELDLSPVGSLMVRERFFVVVTEGRSNVPFARRINRFVRVPVREEKDVAVNPEIISAYHNDNIVSPKVKSSLEYTDVYFGDADKGLEPGVHTFALTYTVNNALSNIGGSKFFAWDVVGSWELPVLHTSLSIRHPFSVAPMRQSFFFGDIIDQRIHNYSDKGNDDSYNFLKNEIIYPGQTLLFLELFGKDAFQTLDSQKVYENIFDFNIYVLISFLGLFMVLAYYAVCWFMCSKEKRKILNPSIGDLNEKFFSPAALRLFVKPMLDSKTLSVLLIKLASKGLIKIEEYEDGFVLVRQAAHKDKSGLSAGEKMFFASLFPKGLLKRKIDKSLGAEITNRRRMFETPLLNEFNGQYLKANYSYFLFGLSVMVATVAAAMFVSDGALLMMSVMGGVILTSLLAVGSCVILTDLLKKARGSKRWLKISVAFVVFVGLVSATIYSAMTLSVLTGVLTSIFVVLTAVITALAYTLFKSEDKLGKVLSESTRLYRNYLSSETEIPASTGTKLYDLYIRHVPYALALDLDKEWGKRFPAMFASLGKDDFSWYNGGGELNETFITDLVARLNAFLEENVTFLNPNVQKFK